MRVYEINTLPWLTELSEKYGRSLTLETVPAAEWDALTPYHFDAIWLMGVWQRSSVSRGIAQSHDGVLQSCAAVLPWFNRERDIVGSPYSIRAYTVEERLGGAGGLAKARRQLSMRKLKLILDFVPNHSARDHAWIETNPEFYVQGTDADLARSPAMFFKSGGHSLACGNGEWTDTAQFNAYHHGYRRAAARTLIEIGDQCDGVRCDMPFLLRSDVFASKWGPRAGARPPSEFWKEVIEQVRARNRDLVLIAEAYSGSEWNLQQEGFDYCYDKDKLYERLKAGNADLVRRHLQGSSIDFLKHLIHFIENHDEAPADSTFAPHSRHCLAALAIATLPGASLWHYLQFEGRWGKQIVQLGVSVSVRRFYQRLLAETDRPAIRQGVWTLCSVTGSASFLAWCWAKDEDRILVVLNLSETPKGHHKCWADVAVPWAALRGRTWKLKDVFSGEEWLRSGNDMFEGRLHVGLPSWGASLFELTPS